MRDISVIYYYLLLYLYSSFFQFPTFGTASVMICLSLNQNVWLISARCIVWFDQEACDCFYPFLAMNNMHSLTLTMTMFKYFNAYTHMPKHLKVKNSLPPSLPPSLPLSLRKAKVISRVSWTASLPHGWTKARICRTSSSHLSLNSMSVIVFHCGALCSHLSLSDFNVCQRVSPSC